VWSFPTLEPVILENGSFVIERLLPQPGEVLVSVGEELTPDQVVAQSDAVEQTMTLYVASELGVENKSLSKYIAKSVGSEIKKGDVIARVRRGLRTATVKSPTDGRLVATDESNGTVVLTTAMGRRELYSLVSGKVEQIIPSRGAVVRTSGTRLYGIAGFGSEAIGPLVVGADRPDRELTSDNVSDSWKGSIVLAGMTAGVPALSRLREVGAAAVIMGSIPEGDLRRFLTDGQMDRMGFWAPVTGIHGDLYHPAVEPSLVIIVTEGFGRRPMNERVFEVLQAHAGKAASVSARVTLGDSLTRPEIYLTEEVDAGHVADDEIRVGRTVRLVDSGVFSISGEVATEPYVSPDRFGVRRVMADVEVASGAVRSVPVTNIEVVE
jgi:hypothetical protein